MLKERESWGRNIFATEVRLKWRCSDGLLRVARRSTAFVPQDGDGAVVPGESKAKLMFVLHSELLLETETEGQFPLLSHLSFTHLLCLLKLKSKFLLFES